MHLEKKSLTNKYICSLLKWWLTEVVQNVILNPRRRQNNEQNPE